MAWSSFLSQWQECHLIPGSLFHILWCKWVSELVCLLCIQYMFFRCFYLVFLLNETSQTPITHLTTSYKEYQYCCSSYVKLFFDLDTIEPCYVLLFDTTSTFLMGSNLSSARVKKKKAIIRVQPFLNP